MLTTKQFINKVNELECFVADISEKYEIKTAVVHSKNQVADSIHRVVAIGDAVHFYNCDLSSLEDIKLLNLITEYVNTPYRERIAEEKYYIHWTDFDGTMYFLTDVCYSENGKFGNNNDFESVEELVRTEREDVYHYQFTESDIKKLPKQWIPAEFGGIGFTKIISVN